jgi:soluble lytic murein transglycosylase-like protein
LNLGCYPARVPQALMTGRLVLALTLVVLVPSLAHAQIYAMRDDRGMLILSDRPLGPGAQTFAVARTTELRTTRAVDATASDRYGDVIDLHASRHQVRPDLVRAVIQVESAFNPYARSNKGAMGLMQLMPATAADYGVDNPYNPRENIRAGVAYLRSLLDRFGGNEELALAAYNAGPGAVEKYGQRIPPYRETRDYVERVRFRSGALGQARRRPTVYKTVDIVDGREIPRYSTIRPASGDYEVVDTSR